MVEVRSKCYVGLYETLTHQAQSVNNETYYGRDLLMPTTARNLGPPPQRTLCIASQVVRSWHMQCNAACLGPQLQRFSYFNGQSSGMTSPPCQPFFRFPAFTPPSVLIHPVRTYLHTYPHAPRWSLLAPRWSLRRVSGLRAVNACTAPT